MRIQRSLKYSRCQQVAYHEAAHALAALRHNIPFRHVQMLSCENKAGTNQGLVEFPTGTMEFIARRSVETCMLIFLSGIAADKLMRPHVSYFIHMIGTGAHDWNQAEFAASRVKPWPPHHKDHAFNLLKTDARRFVREEWQNMVGLNCQRLAA
jgi:hypothetical protein